ncbi:unnamed protein product, partial [Adineta steineri]
GSDLSRWGLAPPSPTGGSATTTTPADTTATTSYDDTTSTITSAASTTTSISDATTTTTTTSDATTPLSIPRISVGGGVGYIRHPALGGVVTYTSNVKVRFLQPPPGSPPGPLIN